MVDHGSSDGTVSFVRERFPEVEVVEQENRGLAYGWNTGIARTSGRYVLLLNSDAWLDDGALDQLASFADAHPEAAVVGPRLRYPDGRLQRSVRGFPTLWRLATEFFYLRKLAPGTEALNAFYAGGFDHASVREAEVLMGAVWLVRRAAIVEVGPADDAFFLFSEETDWAYRFRDAGWKLLLLPGCRRDPCVCGLAQGTDVRREPARATALPAQASGRRLCGACAAAAARRAPVARRAHSRRPGPDVPRGRGLALFRARRRPARMSLRVPPLLLALPLLGIARLLPEHGFGLWLRLVAATLVLLLPGRLVARALGRSGPAAALAWSVGLVAAALALTFAVHGSLDAHAAARARGGSSCPAVPEAAG